MSTRTTYVGIATRQSITQTDRLSPSWSTWLTRSVTMLLSASTEPSASWQHTYWRWLKQGSNIEITYIHFLYVLSCVKTGSQHPHKLDSKNRNQFYSCVKGRQHPPPPTHTHTEVTFHHIVNLSLHIKNTCMHVLGRTLNTHDDGIRVLHILPVNEHTKPFTWYKQASILREGISYSNTLHTTYFSHIWITLHMKKTIHKSGKL